MLNERRKQRICALLKGIETGDPASTAVVHPDQYIQHNPQTHEGGEGLAALFKRLSMSSPRVNIVRIFADGDFVFGHTEYDFSRRRVGFEVFRFEGELAVEHWDNIQSREGPNRSGHSMVDGVSDVTDQELTEPNRTLLQHYVNEVLINGRAEDRARFIDSSNYIEHHPHGMDGQPELNPSGHQKLHRILADGNFVLTLCEGYREDTHSSFFDLFRVHAGMIVEHWDTIEAIPPRSEWHNDNGKF